MTEEGGSSGICGKVTDSKAGPCAGCADSTCAEENLVKSPIPRVPVGIDSSKATLGVVIPGKNVGCLSKLHLNHLPHTTI